MSDESTPATEPEPTPALAPEPTPASNNILQFIQPDGTLKDGWHETIPDLPPSLKKFQSFEGLAKSYVNLESMLGKGDKIPVLSEASSPEEVALFRSKMGIPEDPSGYELAKPEGVPDEIWDPESLGEFTKLAHDLALSPNQAQKLAEWEATRQSSAFENVKTDVLKSRDEASAALKEEWGAEYQSKLNDAEKGAAAAGLSPEVLKGTPEMSNNPHFIKAMAYFGAQIKEKPTVQIRTNAGHLSINTPAAAQAEIDRIYNDKSHPYHAGKQSAVDEMAKLHAIVNPERD